MFFPGMQTKGTTYSTQKWPKTILEELWRKRWFDHQPLPPLMPQEAIEYCTKLYTSGQSIIDHFILNIELNFWCFYSRRNMDPHKRLSKSQGLWYPWVETIVSKMGYKWSAAITSIFNLVAKEGFLTSWTIDIIQIIF